MDIMDTVRNSTMDSSLMKKKMSPVGGPQAAASGDAQLQQALMNRKMRQPTKKPNVPYRKK